MQIIKKTRRQETREDLKGLRINSEEPNPIGCDAIGFKHSNPTLSSAGIPLKSGIRTGTSPRDQTQAF